MWIIDLNRNLFLAVAMLVAFATQPASFAVAQEAELIAVLRSDANLQTKSAACLQLARIGTKASVPVLASLLDDEQLSHMARYAMEPIDDSSVDDALRDALSKLQGQPQLGVIGSLGVRRDVKAVDALAELLQQSSAAESETARAAARALGNIGTPAAAISLQSALQGANPSNQKAICEGLLRSAESIEADALGAESTGTVSNELSAQAIYDSLRVLETAPPQVRAAALRGAVLSRGKDGVPLLVEALKGSDYGMAAIAVRAAMESPYAEFTEALLDQLPDVAPERKGLLIPALADRGDSRVLPAVLSVIDSEDDQLRILAFRALKRVGDASCVPALLGYAAGDNPQVSQAAIDSLETLQGNKAVDEQIVSRLTEAEGKMRMMLIDLAGRRRTVAAVPALWQAADDTDPTVRAAALTSLGNLLETSDLQKLIARLGSTQNESEAVALDKALRDVCLRSEDREQVAAQLAAALVTADGPVKGRILDTLNLVGGNTSLKTVASAAKSDDLELRDEAFRVLGAWRSSDAAPVLMDLYSTEPSERLRIRAIRAYIRIARQFDMPADTRAEMCRTALKVATRDADKRLVLEVLLRYPVDEMQEIALQAAEIPTLKDQALLVVMGMANKGINRAELGKALAQAGQKPVELEILKAEYGVGKKSKDVTATLRKHAKSYRIIFLPNESYNQSFDGDPAPGERKQLKISYRIDGKEAEVSLNENATVILPEPK